MILSIDSWRIMLIIAILSSFACPVVLRKYDLSKYENTFKARSKTSVKIIQYVECDLFIPIPRIFGKYVVMFLQPYQRVPIKILDKTKNLLQKHRKKFL